MKIFLMPEKLSKHDEYFANFRKMAKLVKEKEEIENLENLKRFTLHYPGERIELVCHGSTLGLFGNADNPLYPIDDVAGFLARALNKNKSIKEIIIDSCNAGVEKLTEDSKEYYIDLAERVKKSVHRSFKIYAPTGLVVMHPGTKEFVVVDESKFDLKARPSGFIKMLDTAQLQTPFVSKTFGK